MKSLHGKAETSMRDAVRPGLLRRGFRKMKLGLATCAVATTMAFGMPLTDARAQPATPPASARTQPGAPPVAKRPVITPSTPPVRPAVRAVPTRSLYTVNGTDTTLNYLGKSRTVYAMSDMSGAKKPVVKLTGPAELTVWVYPVVYKKDVENGRPFNRTIEFRTGPVDGQQSRTTREGTTYQSEIKNSDVKNLTLVNDLTIGKPMKVVVKLGAGPQQFTVLKPNGFLEIISVKRLAKPVTRRKSLNITLRPEPPKKKKPKPKPKKEPRMLFSTNVEHLQLKKLRPKDDSGEKSTGDLTAADILGHIPLGKSGVSLLLGTYVTSYGVVLDTTDANNSLRSLSTNLSLGIGFSRGRHYLTALAFGGYRHMWGKVTLPDGRKNEKETKHGEGGGAFGYAYNPYFSMLVSSSNSPFNPLTVKLHGMLHKGWVKDHKPWLDLDILWLRDAVALDEQGLTGGMALSRDQVYIRALAGLPVVRFSIITLSILAGGEMMISEDRDVLGTALFGAKAEIDWKGLSIGATGLSSIDGAPLVLFNLTYRR